MGIKVIEKQTLGISSTTFSPTFGPDKKEKGNLIRNLPRMNFWSEDVYDWIDEQLIEKGGLKIPGQHPKGTKVLGREIEQKLYSGLQSRLWNAIQKTDNSWEQIKVLKHLENAIDAWRRRMYEKVEDTDKELLRRGFLAGLIDSGKREDFDKYEDHIDVLMMDKNRLLPKFQEFRKQTLAKVSGLVANSYDEEGIFHKDKLENELVEYLSNNRYKLERMVRTEAANMSNAGRLFGWNEDPDKYFYQYSWNSVNDGKSKYISLWRNNQGPYSYPEILFLWEHQSQDFGKPIGVQQDFYNQRCNVSRIQEKSKAEDRSNRWQNVPGFFRTLSLGLD